jgi:hypothetical protein
MELPDATDIDANVGVTHEGALVVKDVAVVNKEAKEPYATVNGANVVE